MHDPDLVSQHHLRVSRTARYLVSGPDTGTVRSIWVALHGYAMLGSRFLGLLGPLAGDSALVVVPEALSRFYLETGRDGRHGNIVGASWLTREDREVEIADAVGYLDLLWQTLAPRLAQDGQLGVLGFSQGAAMAARWIERGTVHPHHTVLWGIALPPEVIPGLGARLRDRELTLVAGRGDPFVPPGSIEEQVRQLSAAGVWARAERFDGGHDLPPEVLRRVTSGGDA